MNKPMIAAFAISAAGLALSLVSTIDTIRTNKKTRKSAEQNNNKLKNLAALNEKWCDETNERINGEFDKIYKELENCKKKKITY